VGDGARSLSFRAGIGDACAIIPPTHARKRARAHGLKVGGRPAAIRTFWIVSIEPSARGLDEGQRTPHGHFRIVIAGPKVKTWYKTGNTKFLETALAENLCAVDLGSGVADREFRHDGINKMLPGNPRFFFFVFFFHVGGDVDPLSEFSCYTACSVHTLRS
jgi:hypothetical protein